MPRTMRDELTAREYEQYRQEKEMFELQSAHQLRLKEKDLELARLETKWATWLRIPIIIITLPVRCLFAFSYPIHVIRKSEPSEAFWRFLR